MDFIPSVTTYASDLTAQLTWGKISDLLGDVDGIAYYRHPIISTISNTSPDLTFIAEGYYPHVIKIIDIEFNQIKKIGNEIWDLGDQTIDSPILDISDMLVSFDSRLNRNRLLRNKIPTKGIVYFPHITKAQLFSIQPSFESYLLINFENITILYSDFGIAHCLKKMDKPLNPTEWRLAKSVFQGINPLNFQPGIEQPKSTPNMGEALKVLEKEIALLDREQHRVAIQMAPGPQRIRGLAGTGKTVVLAMKAANIHRRYPDKKILFTFYTQSLYNQIKKLVTKFYREFNEEDPNWDLIHIRHGWGGKDRGGVYTDLCKSLGKLPINFSQAQSVNPDAPFHFVCNEILKNEIEPAYDYILVDEAQDFPVPFFKILSRLIEPTEKKIYFAYDELQSLSSLEIPSPEELFGTNELGDPIISLEGEYAGPIEKDFVLHKSYRCPLEILMLAHGTGLGISRPKGCVQMFKSKESWNAVGYTVESGSFEPGSQIILYRPAENSPNRIKEIYSGDERIIEINNFKERIDELIYVADSIEKAINIHGLPPEQILVISFDTIHAKKYFSQLQQLLFQKKIHSTIPGLSNQSWEFAESGTVTLATVYRAKGNEAAMVFVIASETIQSYADVIENRNRAFAAISRAKAWIRISGIGAAMNKVQTELQQTIDNIPKFKFIFPDINSIRSLDATETTKRRKNSELAKAAFKTLNDLPEEVIFDVPEEIVKMVLKKIKSQTDEHQ